MSSDTPATSQARPVITARGLGKTYPIYRRPQDRLKQSLWRGRRRFYHEVPALLNLDFEVQRGETVGVVGRNGCGKSTLLQLVAGTLAPNTGTLDLDGSVAGLLELGTGFNPEFTGIENIYLNAAIMGLDREQIDERLEAITAFADIGAFVHHPVKTYSSGMYMRLAFATAIHVDPDILLIDEALAVGDEAFQRKCFSRLEQMKAAGTTLLFVSHSAASIIELCDRALLLDAGERLLYGSPKLVVTRYQKLLYSAPERLAELREEAKELDRTQSSEGPGSVSAAAGALQQSSIPTSAGDVGASFDPALKPETTLHYDVRGVELEDLAVLDTAGERVNMLVRGETYCIRYRARFSKQAFGVRFGTTISTTTGIELSGLMSHPSGEAIEHVEPGETLCVSFRFCNRLLPGTYFVRAGCVGVEDGEAIFLHRVIDAAMFRVLPERALPLIGLVDLSDGPYCEISMGAAQAEGDEQ